MSTKSKIILPVVTARDVAALKSRGELGALSERMVADPAAVQTLVDALQARAGEPACARALTRLTAATMTAKVGGSYGPLHDAIIGGLVAVNQ